MTTCRHLRLLCLNEYELIRKYRCEDCGEVMMCACDKSIGRRFLAHQLDHGVELQTQRRVPVTLAFQAGVCRECRGLPPLAFPRAQIHGNTSKIRRFYWRELAFRTMERVATWQEAQHPSNPASTDTAEVRKRIEREVLQEVKDLHAVSPKYSFAEESQEQVIRRYCVELVRLDGTYVKRSDSTGAVILDHGEQCSAEEFVRHHFQRLGFESVFVESSPFHVLFGVFMWLIIQDSTDPHVRTVMFGNRTQFEENGDVEQIWTPLPDDFGTPGYAKRRAESIEAHLSPAMANRDELQWHFDYWLAHSERLRHYLWAHRQEHVDVARKLLEILPADAVVKILRYMIEDYWGRYLGWPDLLIYHGTDFFFAEVKSAKDKLSEDQKRWIRDNHENLHFPFKLVKIHRTNITTGVSGASP